MIFNIEVNNKVLKAKRGDSILETLNQNGISVPTLCRMQGFPSSGACRLCVVEVEGKEDLVPACSHNVEEWMKIHTHSPRVINARRTIVELLLSSHPDDCLYCIRNKNCELQELADELGIRERKLPIVKKQVKKDPSSVSITREPDKCILCGRCIKVCRDWIGISTLDYIGKAMNTIVGPTFDNKLNISNCITCGQCIMVCPTGALHEKDDVNKVLLALQDPDKYVVVQISPTVSVSLAEEFNIRFGKELDELLVATLRRMGFNKVFKTAFAADIMLIQMAEELIDRMEKNERLPILSSNCPAFVKYIEQTYPDLIPNLSVIKSPQQIMGSLVKHHFAKDQKVKAEKIFSVSLMPCTAAKFEASREEFTHKGNSDIDVTLTTRELARMIRLYGLNIQQLAPEVSDTPFVIRTSASKIIGTSGGLAEALYRTLYYKLTGKQLINFKIAALRGNKKIKEYNSKIGNHKIGIAAVNGLSNAVELLDKIIEGKSAYQFIEVMACPGSCVNGGGQPIGSGQEAIKARIKTLYDIDEKESVKASYKNMAVTELFDKYIDKEKESFFQQFITSYQKRDVML
ncbi:MAG: [FeFe] hydrogenase, group A [Bacteroidales bacterium]|jgi:iron-only hydrogenase group A|nr:(2Fe-2S)-binding protein [Bacteroidales bacterium]MDI9591526.1 [FeFe] hydrogenase, group A [Bacteroidota bacterium]OQC38628.1 MAG: NADP-reducing hydrogenase subunit HndC [Bacteroidetes bacterium ADurb.Bin041]HNY58797.1 [FeFe] hydrogenase, group A [Bacteroidales bacterium]HOF80367.1 [FeFe] hydrogenase, group A [Bacteroidales bacterium]